MLDALLEELDPDGDAEDASLPPVNWMAVRSPTDSEPRLRSVDPPASLSQKLRAGASPTSLPLAGAMLAEADLSGLDLTGADLSGTNLARANLDGAKLFACNLTGAMLHGASLDRADFTGANLERANLEQTRGERPSFGGARLGEATLVEARLSNASFVDADFTGADLRAAHFAGARAVGASFARCDVTRATLRDADLRNVDVAEANFDHVDLREAKLAGLTNYESASWIGADIRDITPLGVHLWKRFVGDQNYLHEFRNRGPAAELLYRAWWLTSDCGRSMTRWAGCTLALALLFAFAYSGLAIDYGDHPTWLSPMYFSVVTITTLGYGDVLPASVAAQAVAMVQVTIGYLMLGGLLSILSNKMARRGE